MNKLNQSVLSIAQESFETIFSGQNKQKIAAKLSELIDTGLAATIEKELFFDAMGKVEKTLIDTIPAKVLSLIRDADQGLEQTEDTTGFTATLTEKLNRNVDIAMLDEDKQAVFFKLLIDLLIKAMQHGNQLDEVIEQMG